MGKVLDANEDNENVLKIIDDYTHVLFESIWFLWE